MSLSDSGLEVIDLSDFPDFANRRLHPRDPSRLVIGMGRLSEALLETPKTVLQQLVNSAVDLCGADSAGISVEHIDRNDSAYYQWVATAGEYRRFLDAMLPRFPSACGICLERGRPQLFRVSEPFFELMGMEAATVTDGLLLPWRVGETRGTIWIMAHGRTEAFDREDLELMQMFASFAALGVARQERQSDLRQQWAATASSAVTHALALRIEGPLRKLTDTVFLAAHGDRFKDAKSLATELAEPLQALAQVVEESLGRTVGRRPN